MLGLVGGFLAFAQPAAAQYGPAPSFGAATTTGALGTQPHAVVLSDLDHDNDLDLVVTLSASNTIAILLNNGAGAFALAGPLITTGLGPYGAAVGDLNNDTHNDIVIAIFGDPGVPTFPDAVQVFLGLGNGTFGAPTTVSIIAGAHPYSVALANINADANLDLVTANEGNNSVSVLFGNGTGGFGAPTHYPVGPGPRGIAVADVNNDTFKEVITTNFNGGFATVNNDVSVLPGAAGGTFGAAAPYTAGQGARSVSVADFNTDGRQDLAVANNRDNTLSVLLGAVVGFSPAQQHVVTRGPWGTAIGDFNVNGRVDVAVANIDPTPAVPGPAVGTVSLLLGNGTGGILQTPPPTITSGTTTDPGPYLLAVGDVNADGKDDIVVSNSREATVSVFLNTIALSADLAITKTGPANVNAGENIVYTTAVTNPVGPNTATTVVVSDTTPTGLTFVSNTGACTTAFPCALGSVTPGQTRTITSTYTVAAGYSGANPLLNTATVATAATDPTPGNNSSTASTTVGFSANLGITKTGPANVNAGQNIVYTTTVTNAGPSNASGVSVADTTPTGLTFVSNTGACTTAFPCNLGTVAPGATPTITSTYTVAAGYSGANPLLNTATVSATTTDPTPGNNSSTASTTVGFSANLGITKTGPANINAGQNIVYTTTVTNAGPSNASGVSVADTTPTGLTFVSNTGACTTAFPCALGTVAPGATPTITSTYTVSPGYSGANPLLNTATVSATTTDPTPGNNSSTASTTVGFSANVGITKTGPASVAAGQNVVYTITVSNVGPSNAAAVTVADATPTGLTFVSNTGACTTAFPCALGTVAPGATPTITATYAIPAGYTTPNPVVNTATVSSTTADPAAGNNTSTTSATVVAASADLAITKTGPASGFRGENIVYTITVTNNGPTAAAAVQVADTTPAGLTFVSNAGDCTSAFPCSLGSIPPSQSRTITATFSIPEDYAGAEPVLNTASVTSSTSDPNAANNSATASSALDKTLFNTVTPCRIVDTRDMATGGPAIAAGTARAFQVTGGTCGIPATARSVSVNVTVTEPTNPGNFRIYPGGTPAPETSTINYGTGETRANNAVVSLGATGTVEVLSAQPAGTAHFILDVNGYFE